MFGKILSLLSLSGAMSSFNITKKFVAAFIVIMAMAMIGAVIAGALVLFGLYECHGWLIRHGLDVDMAALLTGFIGLLILAGIIAAIIHRLNKLQAIPLAFSGAGVAGSSAASLLRGFYRGLKDKNPA